MTLLLPDTDIKAFADATHATSDHSARECTCGAVYGNDKEKVDHNFLVMISRMQVWEMEALGGNPIASFSGQYRFLSNFFIVAGGVEGYPSSEHFFQAAKTLDLQERERFKNPGMTPGQSKREGRKLQLRADWDKISQNVMREILRIKFARGTQLAQQLIDTGRRPLIEGNHWHDQIWGDCTCGNADGKHPQCLEVGRNLLGRILMQLRLELTLYHETDPALRRYT